MLTRLPARSTFLLALLLLGVGSGPWLFAQSIPAESEAEVPVSAPVSGPDVTLLDGRDFAARSNAFLRYEAKVISSKPLYPKMAMVRYVARLLTGTDLAYAKAQFEQAALTTLAKGRAGIGRLDPFDKHALLHAWLLCRSQITPPATQAIHDYMQLWHHRVWKGYGALNYRLMMDGSGFLAAEQWPDLIDADGLNAEQIKAATKQRLLGYFHDITHFNFAEYESPTYEGFDLAAMKMLADFAQDTEVKTRAGLTLDWMLLNIACSWNQGYNTSPAGRAKYWGSTNTSPDEMDATATIGWLYFGGDRPIRGRGTNDAGSLWFAAPGSYHPPEVFATIAQDRSQPVESQGSFAVEGRANSREWVRMTIYHSPSYSLASQWEELAAPTSGLFKETRRQMLKWISPQKSSTFCPLQENPRRPYKLSENVANAWGYGENPYGQSLQDAGTLIGVTNVPPEYPYYKLYAPFSQSGSIVQRIEKEGWIFCHGGPMLFAFRFIKPAAWGKPEQGEEVIWSDARKNGWVLETAERKPYQGGGPAAELNRFAADILAKTKLDASQIDAPNPQLTFTSLAGHVLRLAFRPFGQPYQDQNQIDGQPVLYGQFPLLGNPWVRQAVGGDVLTIRHGTDRLTYDFNAWTKAEE